MQKMTLAASISLENKSGTRFDDRYMMTSHDALQQLLSLIVVMLTKCFFDVAD